MSCLSIFLVPSQSFSPPLYPRSVASQGTRPNSFSFQCLHLWTHSWVHQRTWGCISFGDFTHTKDIHWLMFFKPSRTWGSTMNTLMFEASSLSDETHVLAFQKTHTTTSTKFDVHELTLHHAHITFCTQ